MVQLSLGGCDKLTDAGVGSLSTLTALTALLLSGNTKVGNARLLVRFGGAGAACVVPYLTPSLSTK